MKSLLWLLYAFFIGLSALGAQNPDSCTFSVYQYKAWSQNFLRPDIPEQDTLNIFSVQWSTGQTTLSIPVNAPGVYCVTLTFVSGCVDSSCYNYEPGPVPCATHINQNGAGDLFASVSHAVPPVQYAWSTGENTASVTPAGPGLTYCVTITDAGGCTAFDCYTTTMDTCGVTIYPNGDTLNAQFMGADTAGVEFLWSNGESGSSIYPSGSGNYCVTATNAAGCSATACYLYTVCNLSTSITAGANDGNYKLSASAANGQAPLAYAWSFAGGQITSTLANPKLNLHYLPYHVTVTDAGGCSATAVFNDSTCRLALSYELTINGVFVVELSGVGFDLMPWTMQDGRYGEFFNTGTFRMGPAEPGAYSVTMTDAAGCVQTDSILIPACAVRLFEKTDSSVLAAVFGEAPIALDWSDPQLQGNPVMPPVGWDSLCVFITDATGCTATDCNVPGEDAPGGCSSKIRLNALLAGDTVELSATGNAYNIASYAWNTGDSTNSLLTNIPGVYAVTVTFTNGCVATDSFDLIQAPLQSLVVNVLLPGSGQPKEERFGDLWLIEYDSAQGGILIAIDTVPFVSGLGKFQNIPPGRYLVKASLSPQSTEYPNYIPTYWDSAALWSEAREPIINIYGGTASGLMNVLNMGMLAGQNPGGPGFIGGLVSEGANRPENFANIQTNGIGLLLTLPDGTPVKHAVTDASGQFQMDNLAYGTYYLWVDVPGLPPVYVEISLTPDAPTVSGLNIFVDEDSVRILTATGEPGSGESVEQLVIYPNVTHDRATVDLRAFDEDGSLLARVFNATGQLIYQVEMDMTASMALEVGTWTSGNYLVIVRSENGKWGVGKLFKP